MQKGTYGLISDAVSVDTAVVFVHGFLGDAQGTWLNFQELICSPRRPEHAVWSRCDVFFFSYRSFRDDITESAEALLKFIRAIFPEPPDSIFKSPQTWRPLPALLALTKDKPIYKQLVLVGHSEGGIVIRRAVDIAYSKEISGETGTHPEQPNQFLMARLALFAPAHKGVKLSGWIGACLSVGRVDAILMPFLNLSPAFVEMKQRGLLDEIETHIMAYRSELMAEKKNLPSSLRAHVVFGSNDNVVQKGFIVGDCFHESENGKDHISICKPKDDYHRPVRFVLKRVEGEEKCTDSSTS
jgi:hypothetical protein